MHFWHTVLLYYAVITVIFHYYAVSMHDTGNRNVVKNAAKCQGNVREFYSAGDWSLHGKINHFLSFEAFEYKYYILYFLLSGNK